MNVILGALLILSLPVMLVGMIVTGALVVITIEKFPLDNHLE